MKKIAVITAIILLVCITLSCFVFADPFSARNDNNDANKVVKTASIALGEEKITATFVKSQLNYKGLVLDKYHDSKNNTYTTHNNKVLSVNVAPENRTSTTIKTEAELKAIADRIMKKQCSLYADMELEKIHNPSGNGELGLTFYYCEKIGGFVTENSATLSLDKYGNMVAYSCIDYVDYSRLDASALAEITDSTINSYVYTQMELLLSGEYSDAEVENIYLVSYNDGYALQINVCYKTPSRLLGLQVLNYEI